MRNAITHAALLLLPVVAPALGAGSGNIALDYRVDWRLWHAGDIRLVYQDAKPNSGQLHQAEVSLRTRGFVNTLYGVDNHYTVQFDKQFCADSYDFKVKEGRKRRRITTTYQQPPGRASFLERDLARDRIASRKIINVPACVHDELAALARFRGLTPKTGETVELPISNGKKSVTARISAGRQEKVRTPAGEFNATRYEVFLFNNVLYRRKGRLFVWITDDERRLPVQFQLRLRVYFGTITIRLVKEETL